MIRAFFWKLMERFGVQGIQFALQILLARILEPEHYGELSLMMVFVTLANVFVQQGFNTSLIQNKDVSEDDYSSVFWVSLSISVGLYGIVFVSAPLIAKFYNMPGITVPLRVLALTVIPGAFNSVQLAKVSREMDFKKVFYSNVGGILIAGVVGIIIAHMGGGLWALVVQNLLNITVACIVMLFTVKWHPKLVCDLKRVAALFRFGWKLLVSTLLETSYQELRSLVVGKKYDSGTLAYYNRGKQFPQFIINAVNGTVQSVMLPAMSAEQDDTNKVKTLMRISMTMSAYIVFPMMFGLAAVASPLVSLLLTDKWLPCVPYMQIYCFSLAFYPVHSCNLQAINAMGRSDLFLKLEMIKKCYGIVALAIAVFCFDSPLAIAATGLFTTWISWFVNSFPNKKLIGYSYKEQIKDILPSLILSLIMFMAVSAIGNLKFCTGVMLVIQIIMGVLVYLLVSVLSQVGPYKVLESQLKKYFKKQ